MPDDHRFNALVGFVQLHCLDEGVYQRLGVGNREVFFPVVSTEMLQQVFKPQEVFNFSTVRQCRIHLNAFLYFIDQTQQRKLQLHVDGLIIGEVEEAIILTVQLEKQLLLPVNFVMP